MKQFGTILDFELKNYFKNRLFVGITIFLAAVIAVIMFFPRVMSMIEDGGAKTEESEADGTTAEGNEANGTTAEGSEADGQTKGMILLSVGDMPNAEALRQALNAAFLNYEVCLTDDDLDAIQKKVIAEAAACAFVMDSPTSYTYYVNNLSIYDDNTAVVNEVLSNVNSLNALMAAGLTAEEAEGVLSVEISNETVSLGKDQMQNFFYTYIMIFSLYLVILLYGQMVATNVATEKSSRAMELLVTSAKPTSMMFGKVIASCLAGFVQLLVVFGSAILFYNLNKEWWGDNMIVESIFGMPMDLFVFMLIFFVLGFFIYAFLFGAIGSLASKVEDINTSSMPLTLLFVAGFMIVMFSMQGGDVDSLLMRICSYVPFTSPMAMFTRIAMSTVPFYEILLSILILITSVVGVGVVSAKIYRVGVLLYGTKPKLGSIFQAMRKA